MIESAEVEAVVVSRESFVAECTGSNLNDGLRRRPRRCTSLPGRMLVGHTAMTSAVNSGARLVGQR